jgi:hypothetical protein
MLGAGVVGGVLGGAILLLIAAVRSFARGWREGLEEIRQKRLAKGHIQSNDSDPKPAGTGIPPTSDL